jgi:hypothetical protein
MNDELNEAQLAELKALLEKAEQDVTQGLSASSADAKPVDLGLSIGRLSRVDALQQQLVDRVEVGRVSWAKARLLREAGEHPMCREEPSLTERARRTVDRAPAPRTC